jgi:predicted nucleic acid-binding protein
VTLVIDASVAIAALTYRGEVGEWAARILKSDDLAAPYLMHAEAVNILRRQILRGDISEEAASLAHADLFDMEVRFHAYEPFADRIWQLRTNVVPYDGWYVAIAEALDSPLATIDRRLARAPGPRCEFIVPPVA